MDSCIEQNRKMTLQNESYFCLLSLRDSTERIARLYYSYIQLRQAVSGEAPAILITMLLVLQQKRIDLHNKLLDSYPEHMASGKWHNQEQQIELLDYLSEESRTDLQQLCTTEMKLLLLVSEMMKR